MSAKDLIRSSRTRAEVAQRLGTIIIDPPTASIDVAQMATLARERIAEIDRHSLFNDGDRLPPDGGA